MSALAEAFVTLRADGSHLAADVQRQSGGLVKAAEGMGKKFATALKFAAVGAGAAGAAAVAFGVKSVHAFESVGKETKALQRYIGGTAEEVSRLRFAAVETGVGTDALSTGLRMLSKNLVTSHANTKGLNPLVKALGFNFKDAHGQVKPLNDILPRISDIFAKMPDGANKTALAMKLFGRAGGQLLPFLSKGSKGLAELAKKSDELGLTMSGKDLAAIKANALAHREFSAAMEGVQVRLGRVLFPLLTRFAKFLVSDAVPAVATFGKWLSGVVGPAVAFIGQVLDANLPKVQSFIDGFTGGGAGKFASWGKTARDTFEAVKKSIQDEFLPAIKALAIQLLKFGLTVAQNVAPYMIQLAQAMSANARVIVPLAVAVVGLNAAIGGVSAVIQGVQAAIVAWNAVTGAAIALHGVFAATVDAETGAVTASKIALFGAAIASGAETVALTAMYAAEGIAAAATWALNAALAVLTSPITLVVAGIALLALGLVYAWKHSETFRSVVTSAFQGVLLAVSALLTGFGKFLSALGHIPGFGWAKTAAAVVYAARDAVDRLRNSLDRLPKNKNLDITVGVAYIVTKTPPRGVGGSKGLTLVSGSTGTHHSVSSSKGGYATGTNWAPGGWSWVGEQGPELVNLPTGSKVKTAGQSAAMAGGIDYDRLGAVLAGHVQAVIQGQAIRSDRLRRAF